ncbi:MAG: response regulator [Campylobacterales bacterium]|nr:response regulator [Campylobacterales bacterium]
MGNKEILKNKSILYVEDDKDTSEMFAMALRRYTKKVFVSYDGEDGFKSYQENNPDIIVTDIEMPKKNGLELLRLIKEDDPNKPVIILTAYKDQAHFGKEANGIIVKPFKISDFLEELYKVC